MIIEVVQIALLSIALANIEKSQDWFVLLDWTSGFSLEATKMELSAVVNDVLPPAVEKNVKIVESLGVTSMASSAIMTYVEYDKSYPYNKHLVLPAIVSLSIVNLGGLFLYLLKRTSVADLC